MSSCCAYATASRPIVRRVAGAARGGQGAALSVLRVIQRGIALSVILAAASGSAEAQSFNQFVGFGDSSIDSGFYRTLPNPGGGANFNTLWPAAVAAGAGKPTTSPGLMNSEALAAY